MFPTEPTTNEPRRPAPSAAVPQPAPGAVRPGPWASRFEELTVDLGGDVVEFRHVRNNTAGQHIALAVSAAAFTAFIVLAMPLMHLSGLSQALWVIGGIVVLALVALVMQARVQTTRLVLDRSGVAIDQGTDLDKESIVIVWSELAGVDLEPVSETDGRKGMCLRLRPRVGEPIDTLGGVGVGELNDVRRVILEAMTRQRNESALNATPRAD